MPEFTDELWYGNHPVSLILAPLGWVYSLLMRIRRLAYKLGLLPTRRVSVPVIIVGNITVGGTGKTPFVIWMAKFLVENGYKPGIISRGYGGSSRTWPQQVRPDSDPVMVGDEPVIIARRTRCPVAASPDRYSAAREMLNYHDCNILVCDDGLQHQALARDIEIIVIDSVRRFGNGRCLPAGPLRESASRLNTVDLVIANGPPEHGEYQMAYTLDMLKSVAEDGREEDLDNLKDSRVHAVAGTGNPASFFATLRNAGLQIIEHAFPDHYYYKAEDISFDDNLPVVMTEKDAIKCVAFAKKNHWYLPIDARMTDVFIHRFTTLLKEITDG